MSDHGAFGQTRRAGGVRKDSEVVPRTLSDRLLKLSRVVFLILVTQSLHLLKRHQPRIIVPPETTFFPINHVFYIRHTIPDFQQLVALLLVMGNDEDSVTVVDDVFNFIGDAVGEDADGRPPRRLHS